MYKCLVRNGLLSRAWRLVVDQAINYSKFKDHSCRILDTLLSAFMERTSGLEISYQVFPSCIPWHGIGKYCQRLKPSWKILVNGKDYPIYYIILWKKNGPNHQPVQVWSTLMSDLGLSEHRVRIQRLIITVSSHHLMDFLWASNKSHRHFIGSMPIKSHQKVKYKSRCISLSTLRCPTVELIVNHHVPIQSHHKFHDQHPYQTHDNATSILNLIKSNYSLTHWWFQPIWMILYI